MNDDQLHSLLRQTPAQVKLPASFVREVWARIEAEAFLTFGNCLSRLTKTLFVMLARPLPASLTIAALIALGAWLGGLGQADQPEGDEMVYVQSIHPLLQGSMENMP